MPTNEQLEQLKSALEAENSLSKSQLQELLEIGSRNTLRDTLKSCGLETKKERYTAEEIWQNFIPARQMLEGGQTYKEVAEHFGFIHCGGEEVDSTPTEGAEVNGDAGLIDGLGVGVAEGVVRSVEESVEQILPFVPQLVVHTLKQKLNSQEMRTAISEEMNKQLEREREKNSGSGTAFLLQKMRGKEQNQLTGTAQPEQNLLEASVENSSE